MERVSLQLFNNTSLRYKQIEQKSANSVTGDVLTKMYQKLSTVFMFAVQEGVVFLR